MPQFPMPPLCTRKWFSRSIVGTAHDPPDDIEVTLAEITPIFGGVLSHIASVKLQWSRNCGLPTSVIIKIPTSDKAVEEVLKNGDRALAKKTASAIDNALRGMHSNECFVYTHLQKSNIEFLPVLKCYAAENITGATPGILLMEDLTEVAAPIPVTTGYTIEQAKEIIKAIAAIQVEGLRFDGWKLAPTRREDLANMEENVVKMFNGLKSAFPKEYDGISLDELKPLINVDSWMNICHLGDFLPRVLVHGDLWSNNILMERRDGIFTDKIAAIIDWQMCHLGQPGEDLARLIGMTLGSDQRRRHEGELLQFFYTQLTEQLGSLPPFSFEYVLKWFRHSMHYQAVFMIVIHSIQQDVASDTENRNLARRVTALLRDVVDGVY